MSEQQAEGKPSAIPLTEAEIWRNVEPDEASGTPFRAPARDEQPDEDPPSVEIPPDLRARVDEIMGAMQGATPIKLLDIQPDLFAPMPIPPRMLARLREADREIVHQRRLLDALAEITLEMVGHNPAGANASINLDTGYVELSPVERGDA